MKLTGVQLPEERLSVIAQALNHVIQTLQPLNKLNLPKEIEPTTSVMCLRSRPKD
jgi:Asp-tRNA(Asn)/Glu-tRNA(Gln) amidotransferase C subunit